MLQEVLYIISESTKSKNISLLSLILTILFGFASLTTNEDPMALLFGIIAVLAILVAMFLLLLSYVDSVDPFYNSLRKNGVIPGQNIRKTAHMYIYTYETIDTSLIDTIKKHRNIFRREVVRNKSRSIEEAKNDICRLLRDYDIEIDDEKEEIIVDQLEKEWEKER